MKRIIIVGSIVLVILLLGAGAFTAVRLITAQTQTEADLPPGAMVFEDVRDDGSGNPITVKTIIDPAPELPDEQPEAGGVFLRQEDNSYFVGTGSVSVSVNIVNGERSAAVEHSGPEVEVVVTRDTRFYQDVTEVSFEASESKEQRLQQEVKEVDRPDLVPEGASITVWGQRRGDRVVANVIVYSESQ